MVLPDDSFLREFITPPLPSKRGCAFLGKSNFDKLGAVKSFLAGYGINELGTNKEIENSFVVHDCRGKAQRVSTIANFVAKYRDAAYVIFDNCEKILKDEQVIRLFVNLVDEFEYTGSYSFSNSKGVEETFSSSSFFIFLGKENLLQKETSYPLSSASQDLMLSFRTYVQCYDFDVNSEV